MASPRDSIFWRPAAKWLDQTDRTIPDVKRHQAAKLSSSGFSIGPGGLIAAGGKLEKNPCKSVERTENPQQGTRWA